MDAPRIKVVGDREVRATLRALGTKVRRTILVRAMDLAMGPMHRRALSETPVDSGNLAAHVAKVVKGEERGRMRVDVVAKKVDAPYIGPVEYGAPNRGRLPDEFMLRAFDSEAAGARATVERLIVEQVEREADSR